MLENEKIQKIQELYKLGLTKSRIAKEMNCCVATVTKYTEKSYQEDDLLGKKFGYLTVLKRTEKNPNLASRCRRYICQCECGKIIEVNSNSLRTGHTTSCGKCSRKKTMLEKFDLTGEKFGKLTVLYPSYSKDNRIFWMCQCECGNKKEVSAKELKNGSTKSCGCLRSWKEEEISQLLTKKNIKFQREYIFKDLFDEENLRFDFAIFDNDEIKFLIEYQGQQHYDNNSSWYTEKLVRHDKMKKEYCENHNYTLIELNKNSNLEEEIEKIYVELRNNS